MEGMLVLRLAREVDGARVTGSQLSALVDRLLKAKDAAMAGVPPAADAVDELRRRRLAKAAGA